MGKPPALPCADAAPSQLSLQLRRLLSQVDVELLGQLDVPLQFGVLGSQLLGMAAQASGFSAVRVGCAAGLGVL